MKTKWLLLPLLTTLMSSMNTYAACLDGVTSSHSIHSKIRGFYMNKSTDIAVHYVILDKATCVASQTGNVTLGSTTQNYYYLYFDDADKALLSSLLSAQAMDIIVEFRVSGTIKNDTNGIAYIITPSNARSQ